MVVGGGYHNERGVVEQKGAELLRGKHTFPQANSASRVGSDESEGSPVRDHQAAAYPEKGRSPTREPGSGGFATSPRLDVGRNKMAVTTTG